MSDPNVRSLLEPSAIDTQNSAIARLLGEVEALKIQLEGTETLLQEHTEHKRRHEAYPYKISLIITSPHLTQKEREFPGIVDEVIFVESSTEAKAKEQEIIRRQNGVGQKRVTSQAATVRSTPF